MFWLSQHRFVKRLTECRLIISFYKKYFTPVELCELSVSRRGFVGYFVNFCSACVSRPHDFYDVHKMLLKFKIFMLVRLPFVWYFISCWIILRKISKQRQNNFSIKLAQKNPRQKFPLKNFHFYYTKVWSTWTLIIRWLEIELKIVVRMLVSRRVEQNSQQLPLLAVDCHLFAQLNTVICYESVIKFALNLEQWR